MSVEQTGQESAWCALSAWLGAVVDRLRRDGAPLAGPFPDEGEEAALAADAESFGAASSYLAFPGPLPRPLWSMSMPSSVEALLCEVHQRVRGACWEERFWEAMGTLVPGPWPESVAMDLVQRGLCRCLLAHIASSEGVWWELVGEYPEAAYNLAINRYTNPDDAWDRVEVVLNERPDSSVFEMLARVEASSQDKADQLARYVAAHS